MVAHSPQAPSGLWCEALSYAASRAYEAAHGDDEDADGYWDALDVHRERHGIPVVAEPPPAAAVDLQDRASVRSYLPRLARLYLPDAATTDAG